jgi:hypothetical protein
VQPGHTLPHKTPPPLAYRLPVQAQLGRHFLVLTSFRAGQHNPGSQSQRLRRLPRNDPKDLPACWPAAPTASI